MLTPAMLIQLQACWLAVLLQITVPVAAGT